MNRIFLVFVIFLNCSLTFAFEKPSEKGFVRLIDDLEDLSDEDPIFDSLGVCPSPVPPWFTKEKRLTDNQLVRCEVFKKSLNEVDTKVAVRRISEGGVVLNAVLYEAVDLFYPLFMALQHTHENAEVLNRTIHPLFNQRNEPRIGYESLIYTADLPFYPRSKVEGHIKSYLYHQGRDDLVLNIVDWLCEYGWNFVQLDQQLHHIDRTRVDTVNQFITSKMAPQKALAHYADYEDVNKLCQNEGSEERMDYKRVVYDDDDGQQIQSICELNVNSDYSKSDKEIRLTLVSSGDGQQKVYRGPVNSNSVSDTDTVTFILNEMIRQLNLDNSYALSETEQEKLFDRLYSYYEVERPEKEEQEHNDESEFDEEMRPEPDLSKSYGNLVPDPANQKQHDEGRVMQVNGDLWNRVEKYVGDLLNAHSKPGDLDDQKGKHPDLYDLFRQLDADNSKKHEILARVMSEIQSTSEQRLNTFSEHPLDYRNHRYYFNYAVFPAGPKHGVLRAQSFRPTSVQGSVLSRYIDDMCDSFISQCQAGEDNCKPVGGESIE